MGDLRSVVLSAMPEAVLAVLAEIEDHSRRQVEFIDMPPQTYAADRAFGACRTTATSAAVMLRDSGVTNPHTVLHELLHIRRYWTRGIPQVVGLTDQGLDYRDVTTSIENMIEHQVIVPEEWEHGFSTKPFWNETERTNFQAYPWPAISGLRQRRLYAASFYLGLDLCDDPSLVAFAEETLEKEGALAFAKRFRNRIRQTLRRKEDALALVVSEAHIPRSHLRLLYLDPRSGQQFLEPVPKSKF